MGLTEKVKVNFIGDLSGLHETRFVDFVILFALYFLRKKRRDVTIRY